MGKESSVKLAKKVLVKTFIDTRDWYTHLVGDEINVIDCYENSYIELPGMGGIPKFVCEVTEWA